MPVNLLRAQTRLGDDDPSLAVRRQVLIPDRYRGQPSLLGQVADDPKRGHALVGTAKELRAQDTVLVLRHDTRNHRLFAQTLIRRAVLLVHLTEVAQRSF